MKDSIEVEIPLLKDSKQGEPNQNFVSNRLRKDHQSHFINNFTSYSPPDKYIHKTPFLKWLIFLDVIPYISKINRSNHDITQNNILLPNSSFNIETKIIDLDYYWTQQQKSTSPSFYKTLCLAFKSEIATALTLNLIDCTIKICYSLFLGKIINIISESNLGQEIDKDSLFESATILILLIIASFFFANWSFYQPFRDGGKARLAITGLLYKKLHSISLTSLHEFKIGKVINLIANDLNDIDNGMIFLPTMLLCPYFLVLATVIMWGYFGPACLVGLATSVLFLIGQIFTSGRTGEPRKENKQFTDDRIKYTNEIIENIRLIKTYAWEKPFRENVENLRTKEHNTFLKIVNLDAIGRNFSVTSMYFSLILICIVYTSTGGVLSLDKIYASMIILSFLSVFGLMFFHLGRMFLVNFRLILKRIEQVMMIENVLSTSETIAQSNIKNNKREIKVVFSNFTAYWNKNTQKPCLSNISSTFVPNRLATIIGKIGSGKSTFLLSLLRELPVTQGTLEVSGKIAYVEQEPIIFSGTVRENILFGKEYNDELYKKVIKICTLDVDLEILSNGDLTLIGEKGVNLSGGQKARLSLARAIYSESDIYLLDDPFSAVDSKVAREIFENGLRGSLLKNKIVILVTHHLHFARESDHVVVMNDGMIEAQGTFPEIEKMDVDLLNIFNTGDSRKSSVSSQASVNEEGQEENNVSIEKVVAKEAEKKVNEEVITVSFKTYKNYLTVVGTYKDLIQMIIIFGSYQALTIYFTRFIGVWALAQSAYYHDNPSPEQPFDHTEYLYASGLMILVIYVLSYLKRVKIGSFLLSTNSVLHQKMIKILTRAKVIFFDLNPIGRILNRFSNDFGTLDKPNLVSTFDLVDGILNSLSLMLTVCLVNPILFVPGFITIYLLYKIRQFFAKPNILTKKLELASRSPIFSTVSSTLNGLTIIRVYNSGGRFIREFLDLIYDNSKTLLFMMKTFRLFGATLDAAVRGIMLVGIIGFIWLVIYYKIESGLVGLSLLFLLQIGDETSYFIRQTLTVDINMQSAQRMLEYCQLETEPPEQVPTQDNLIETQFQGKWPVRGSIIFNEVFLQYREGLSFALNGLSFSIEGGAKVACVGRTGAGKSSIIQALFRMTEINDNNPESLEQSYIKIDGVDIRTIGLNLLRRRLAIIPQTPVVFTGTIRRNLDPFDEYADNALWNVLEEVNLKNYVLSLENQLDTDMTISASVFSAGQKQLICLARAILKKTKILILDEATANVDIETDDFIQKKIMEKFADCTVVTIAHRLITIAHYDKVVVMDKGRMVEFDSPYKLLVEKVGDERITKQEGIFAEMVRNTGKGMSRKIFSVAKSAFLQKNFLH